jgi:hypothetical protein
MLTCRVLLKSGPVNGQQVGHLRRFEKTPSRFREDPDERIRGFSGEFKRSCRRVAEHLTRAANGREKVSVEPGCRVTLGQERKCFQKISMTPT